jgi:hypothetical protein
MIQELIVGTMMSLAPFTTSAGCLIVFSSAKRSPLISRHSRIAAY